MCESILKKKIYDKNVKFLGRLLKYHSNFKIKLSYFLYFLLNYIKYKIK